MPNSIRTTSNTATATNATPAPFKAGDRVLWAAVSLDTYKLQASSDRLVIHHADIEYSFDADGRASHDDALPSLFHDTPANRQAIATLYGNSAPRPTQKVIDVTALDDDEVIIMPSIMLADAACDIDGAIKILNDVGALLNLIYRKEITHSQAISLARLTHDSTETWADLLCSQLNALNEPLELTRFCTGVITHD